MVLVQASGQRSFPVLCSLSNVHPSPARIVGVAGAIALNGALLMLLLAPMGTPLPPLPRSDDLIAVQTFKPIKPPPLPPVVPVTAQRPATPLMHQDTATPPVPAPVVFNDSTPMDLPAPPAVDPVVPTTEQATPDPGPLAGVRLQYASAPPPSYPRDALVGRVEGTVLLQVLVGVDGTPLEVTVHKSSGDRDLDRAAQQQILKKWKFQPAMKDGRPIQAIGIVPIDFKLD